MPFHVYQTGQLFLKLLRILRIDCVCDIGAMDCSESLSFRRILPTAQLFAFEASPQNYEQIKGDPRVAEAKIDVHQVAVSCETGSVEFYPVETDYSVKSHQRGMGSLYPRVGETLSTSSVVVEATRLDRFFEKQRIAAERIALWVDVEGKAFEVCEGAEGVLSRVQMIHIETETCPCIAPGQKLEGDILRLMEAAGFFALACDGDQNVPQRNWVFVRRNTTFQLWAMMRITCFPSAFWRWLKPKVKKVIGRT